MNERTRMASSLPLCVDMDGTLLRTDTLHELVAGALHRPSVLLQIPLWLIRGRAHLKDRLAAAIALDPSTLPANDELLDYLRALDAPGTSPSLEHFEKGNRAFDADDVPLNDCVYQES